MKPGPRFSANLLLCGVLLGHTAIGYAQMGLGGSDRLELKAKNVLSYEGGRDLIEDFVVEGFSLATPLESVRDILLDNGYEEIISNDPQTLQFIKGGRSPTVLGESSYRILVRHKDGIRRLHFLRQTRVDRRKSDLQLADTDDVTLVRDLKNTICASVADETERWRLCPPDTDAGVRLGVGNVWLKLDEGLYIENLHATPAATVINLFSR